MADAMTNLLDSASAEAVQNLSPIIASLFLRPKRLRVLRIERIGAHAAGHIGVVLDLGDVTVLAIVAAHRVRGREHVAPDYGRRALRNGFVPESRRARRRGRVDRIDQLLERFRRHVAAELGADAAGMHGRGADAPVLVPTVEFHREQDVGRRAAIGAEFGIGRARNSDRRDRCPSSDGPPTTGLPAAHPISPTR
jgi:hypothetical protein